MQKRFQGGKWLSDSRTITHNQIAHQIDHYHIVQKILYSLSQANHAQNITKCIKKIIFSNLFPLWECFEEGGMQLHKKVPLFVALMDMWSNIDLFLYTTSQMAE